MRTVGLNYRKPQTTAPHATPLKRCNNRRGGAAQIKPKKVVTQANTNFKKQHANEKSIKSKGKAYRNANASKFVDASSQIYVNVYLSNAHLQKNCRRQHGLKISREHRKGRIHTSAAADHKYRANADSFNQIKDLALQIDKVEMHHKAGGKYYPEFNQRQVAFDDINDEAPKKLSFGSVPTGTYTKITIYLKSTGSANENGGAITVDLDPHFDAMVDRQFIDEQLPDSDLVDNSKHFTLKPDKQYNIYAEFDVLGSLKRSANGVRIQASKPLIQRIEAIEPELVQMRERQVVFKLKNDTTPEAALEMVQRLHLMPFKIVPGPNIIEAYVDDDASLMDAYADLLGESAITNADFNFLARSSNYTDEPQYNAQKAQLNQVGLPEAWQLQSGSGVKVAVVDTGFDTNNQDLSGALTEWRDVVTGEADATDLNGHGTEVASIIAARHNAFGIAGVNPNAKIIAVKALSNAGTTDYVSLASALMVAFAKGAKIINVSAGGYLDSPILAETVKHLAGEGVIIVAAAGNDSTSIPVYPAAYSPVISVAALGDSNQLAKFSNFGETVDIAAPGHNVPVTTLAGKATKRTGTSYAAPYVTGVLSLALSENSGLDTAGVVSLLQTTSDYAARDHQAKDSGAGSINALRLLQKMRGASYADLALADIWPVRRAAIENSNSPLRLTVENRGTQPSPPATVTVKPEDASLIPVSLPALMEGERREIILDYSARQSIDGVKYVQATMVSNDANLANNELSVHIPVVAGLGNDVVFAKPKAVVIQSEPEKVQLKFSQPILNLGTTEFANFSMRLYEIINESEQLIQTVDVAGIASGEEKFIHFFAEKPFTTEVTKRATYVIRGTLGDENQANNWAMTIAEIGRVNGSTVSILHKETVHVHLAESVIFNYMEQVFAPLADASLKAELIAYKDDIYLGECVEDGDECTDKDPYIDQVDPIFQICGGRAPCALISNEHFWKLSNFTPGEILYYGYGTQVPGVTYSAFLSSYYNAHGVPNAWQRAYIFWTGNGINGHNPQLPAFKGIKDLYKSGDEAQKRAAFRWLGHVLHLLQDMSMPVHAHRQQHATDDDSLEDWEGETPSGEVSGWDAWNGSGVEGAQRAREFFDDKYRSKPGSLPYLLTIPHYLSNLAPAAEAKTASVYPLFYLLQFTNMRAGWFADDRNDGFTYDQPWHNLPKKDFKIGPARLRNSNELSDNDNGFWKTLWKIVCMFVLISVVSIICIFSFIPWIGPALCLLSIAVVSYYGETICERFVEDVLEIHEDNDDDGDLSAIRNQTLPLAYISTATGFCHFFELVDKLTPGTCPAANSAADDPLQNSIGGGIVGLVGSVTLDNAGANKTFTANGTFIMPKFATAGESYNVTVVTQPVSQTCTVINGSGQAGSGDVRNVVIRCATVGDVTPPSAITGLAIRTGPLPGSNGQPVCANFLAWQNPTDTDFFGGVIVRNETHAPLNISDGVQLYNGDIPADNNLVPEGNFIFPNTFTDQQVSPGKTYYYAVISRDTTLTNFAVPATGSVRTADGCDAGIGIIGGGGCFIVTASYGKSHTLDMLRQFRDNVLLQSTWGIAFVSWYYRMSPPLADFISHSEALKFISRNFIAPFAVFAAIYMGSATSQDILYLQLFLFACFIWPMLLYYFRRRLIQ